MTHARVATWTALAAGVLGALGCSDDGQHSADAHVEHDAAAFVPCPQSFPAFAPGLAVSGRQGRIRLELLEASRVPPRKYRNDWTLALTDGDGAPLESLEIARLEAFMPVHGHYGRPDARFEAPDASGQLQATIHFHMRGPWEVQLEASSAAGDDYVVFDVCVEE